MNHRATFCGALSELALRAQLAVTFRAALPGDHFDALDITLTGPAGVRKHCSVTRIEMEHLRDTPSEFAQAIFSTLHAELMGL